MTEVQPAAPATTAPSDEVIAQHVRANEIVTRVKSRALAGLILGAAVWFLAYNKGFADLGPHFDWIAGAIGFVAGWWMGERVVFTLLGGAVTFLIMRSGQGG